MPAADEFDEEIGRVEKQIKLLKKRRELSVLLREAPVSDIEHVTMHRFQAAFKEAIEREIAKMEMQPPEDPSVADYCRDWVSQNWTDRFQYAEMDPSALPHDMVHEVLRGLYRVNAENVERRGETTELYNGYRRSLDRRLGFWRRLFGFAREAGSGELADGAGKRASELRAERRQHEIQRNFSSIAVVFTFATASFMAVMLIIGGLQLYNAVAEGFGIPYQIAACHTELNSGTDSHEVHEHPGEHGCGLIQHSSIADPHQAMQTSLLALEIILVAPLPYLLVLGLTRYIKALAYQERATEFRRELLEFKAFEVALFIAIIAAAIVERTLREGLKYEFAISSAIVLGVLSVYYYLIENASKEIEAENLGSSGESS